MFPVSSSFAKSMPEEPGSFEVGGEHLFTVLHAVASPVAPVLLLGPFAPERNQTYLPWVRWARYLQARNIEVLRFNYRGVGESTGRFEEQNLADWMEDASELACWLERRTPCVPLLLHGLTLGAIIAGRSFDEGTGDGLILWYPPLKANILLQSTLRRWVKLRQLSARAEDRKPFSVYLEQFEGEETLEVNGHIWSSRLWRDSFDFCMPSALTDQRSAAATYDRPVSIFELGREATPLVCGGFGGYEELNDLSWLYSLQFDWITSAIRLPRENTSNEAGNYNSRTRHA